MPVELITDVPEYRIADNVIYIEAPGWQIAMPLRVFERGLARSQRVIREYKAAKADVLAFERKIGGHAARS